ncbi:hypothetical protein ACLRGI_03985 [Paenarthrobacter nitroguajacolicus]|uniref:hypothetical protein n=1 Tax=Paenarthrobacter nitroguajacolicus TaxID=211146 RepID=UPI003AE53707
MDANDMNDPAPDKTMTSTEAAAYLSGLVGYGVSAEVLESLNALGRGPVAEERDPSLAYRQSALDAFLRENGADPTVWMAGAWRTIADQIEAVTADHPELRSETFVEKLRNLESDDGWDAGKAR